MTSITGIIATSASAPPAAVNAGSIPGSISGFSAKNPVLVHPPALPTSRLIDNPSAHILITQYLNGQGQIVAQTPSSAVVAYLQNGLTANGSPPKSNDSLA